MTGDRGLAGAFNSQILRAGLRRARSTRASGRDVGYYASGARRLVVDLPGSWSSTGSYVGFTDRPAYANAREIART